MEPIGKLVPQGASPKKEGKSAHPKLQKVAREPLSLPPAKTLSQEQGKLVKEYLAHFDEKLSSLPQSSIQLVEATRLMILMTQGLAEFEKGKPYVTTSQSGELVTIKNNDQQGFVQAFVADLAYLLKKSEGSSKHKTNLYAIVTNFTQSKTFLSVYPNLKAKKPVDQKGAEEAFLSLPCIDTFADLAMYGPGVIVQAIESSEATQQREMQDIAKLAKQLLTQKAALAPFFLQNVKLFLKNQIIHGRKAEFYNVLSLAENSATLLAMSPQWKNLLEKKRQDAALLSPEKLQEEQKRKEQEFLAQPSLETFVDLVSLCPKMDPSCIKEKTLLDWNKLIYTSEEQLNISVNPKRNRLFFYKCIREIAKLIRSFFAELISPQWKMQNLLTMAHARFHRIMIDGNTYKDSFPVLNGSFGFIAFEHFMKYDWNPTINLLKHAGTVLNKKTKQQLEETRKILDRSKIFFTDHFEFSPTQAKLVMKKISSLKENETLIFPGGMKRHIILYELTKTPQGICLRVFNPGEGTSTLGTQFVVPEYNINTEDTEKIIRQLFELVKSTKETIQEKYGCKDSPNFLSTAIEKIIGHSPQTYSYHQVQDRGNCFWKCFSTWLNSQLEGCTVTVSNEMVEASKKQAPYATADLASLSETKEVLPITRLMHRIAYEKIRNEFTKLFSAKAGPTPSLKEKKLQRFTHPKYHVRAEEIVVTKRQADKYVSSLVRQIIAEPARERYQRKGLMRRWRVLQCKV